MCNGPKMTQSGKEARLAFSDHYGTLISLPCLKLVGQNKAIFGLPRDFIGLWWSNIKSSHIVTN